MRYDFTFNELGEFQVLKTLDGHIPKAYLKMDMHEQMSKQPEFEIIEDGKGCIVMYAPDSWS